MSLLSKTDQLTVFAQPKPYALLQPRKLEPRTGKYHNLIIAPSGIELIYDFLRTANERGDIVAIDFETIDRVRDCRHGIRRLRLQLLHRPDLRPPSSRRPSLHVPILN
jgi:hypothetical protein